MRVIVLVLMAVVALPALAQTGDCTAETGTTTAWGVESFGANVVKTRYTFHAAGVLGQTNILWRSNVAPGTDLTDWANSQCRNVDGSRDVDEIMAATLAACTDVFAESNPENILPAYPEVIATDSNAPTLTDARQRNWHRGLIRERWPEPTMLFSNCILNLWQWVNTQQTPVGRREWWNLTLSQDGEANSRLGGLAGAEAIFDSDRQYFGTNIDEDF